MEFLECKNDALRDILKFLMPLVNPMNLASVSRKLATTVVDASF
jgi:hypothetical protein